MFPVADGDTGDNMALTLRHVIDELDRLEQASADGDPKRPEIVRAVARAALMGARGNSGVILSQIVRGAAEKLATPPGRLIDPEMIEAALVNASRRRLGIGPRSRRGHDADRRPGDGRGGPERRANWNTHHLDTDADAEEQNALLGRDARRRPLRGRGGRFATRPSSSRCSPRPALSTPGRSGWS